ncbi:MAG TPA: hypothetical protein VF758_05410 [Candidatus Acidoferrum sp.]
MKKQKAQVLSRREFAQRAALLSAVPFVPPGAFMESDDASVPGLSPGQSAQEAPKLSPEGQTEAEARYQEILARYGTRLTEEQKASTKNLCMQLQPSLDRVREYALQNGDSPALYLKPLVERVKKPKPMPPAVTPATKKN